MHALRAPRPGVLFNFRKVKCIPKNLSERYETHNVTRSRQSTAAGKHTGNHGRGRALRETEVA
eukprot:88495-Hanusia_phi.AAC.1